MTLLYIQGLRTRDTDVAGLLCVNGERHLCCKYQLLSGVDQL